MSVNRTVENVYIRQEAVQLTRNNFWQLLGIAVIIRFITEVLSWTLTAVGNRLMIPEVSEIVDQYTRLVNLSGLTSSLIDSLLSMITSPKFILFNLAFLVLKGIINAGLSLGRIQQQLDTCRGGYPDPLRIFSGMKLFLKAWGLELWSGLKVGLWALPGMGVMIIGIELQLYEMYDIGNVVMVIGSVLMLALWYRAILRYAMAPYLLADEPDRGIRDCVRTSTGLMKGRLWQYFKVDIPVLFKCIGAMLAASFVMNLISRIIPMDIQLADRIDSILFFAATVYFLVQARLVNTLFYLRTRRPVTLDGTPKPVSYWLREHLETDIEPETPDNEAAEAASEDNHETNEEAKETEP